MQFASVREKILPTRTLSTALLRWAGSKRQLTRLLLRIAPRHTLRYVEPFAGSAALFFAMMPRIALLGDTNPELVNFYRALKRSPKRLHEWLLEQPRNKATYRKFRNLDAEMLDPFERACRFFYLNRHCFNGVYRVNSKGRFNVPMGSKIPELPTIETMKWHAQALAAAEIYCLDFEGLLEECGRGDFVYVDPPYYSARHRGEYGATGFSEDDLERLAHAASWAQERGAKIALSYSRHPALKRLLPDWHSFNVAVRRSVAADARCRSSGGELLLLSYIPS